MKTYQINTEMLDNLLLALGHPEHLSGTQYLREAVVLYASGYARMTKELYPEVAKLFDSTASRVERAIRHSVETAMLRTTGDTLAELFGNTISVDRGKPTNAEYIARLARVCREN